MAAPPDASLLDVAENLLATFRSAGRRIATAESCTGGLVAGLLTEVPGSSDVVERGYVTYSNEAKTDSLDVPAILIERHGAVSAEVARAMALGALARSHADIAVSVTGVAGPGGGTAAKPVGLVHLAVASRGGGFDASVLRLGEQSRGAIRLASVREALRLISRLGAAM